MGSTASKTSSSSIASISHNRVIRLHVSLEQLIAISRNVSAPITDVPPLSASLDSHDSKVEDVEIKQHMLQHVQKIDDFDRVKFLDENVKAFETTASSYRPKSVHPIRLPTNKTIAASSTGIGGANETKVPGRLTARDLRTLLRLHYENPTSWTHNVLAEKYDLDIVTMRNILNSVGPPNVLPPKGAAEFPFGVWYDAPGSISSDTMNAQSKKK